MRRVSKRSLKEGRITLKVAPSKRIDNYRIFDRFDQKVASLAILADENPTWRSDHI